MEIDEFKAVFGAEAEVGRIWLSHLGCFGTQAAVAIVPGVSEEATVAAAWGLVREVASWLLRAGTLHPENERYEIIVGWSREVRQKQGQIFKTGGSVADLCKIESASTHEAFSASQSPLLPNWQKNLFPPSDQAPSA